MTPKILIVDDEENICFTLERFLRAEGYEVMTAGDHASALAALDQTDFDLIFADIVLKGKTGIDLLREIKKRGLQSVVIMFTGVPTVDTASKAVRLGAFDYLPKPVTQQILLRVTDVALRHKALTDEKEKYRSNLEAIFKSVKDAIITVDKTLSVVEINDAATEICGVDCSAVIGKKLSLLNTACGGNCTKALEKTVKSKQSVEIRRLECHRDARPGQVVSLTAYPLINSRNRFSGGVMVIRDETRLATLERDLKARRQFHNIVGESEKMQEIYALIEDLADVRTTVLITGESGTGKELVVDAIHDQGTASDAPLVKVNCAALSENLLESELFGHVKGAFTGAVKDKIGRFQRADGGTIFLDEIGEMTHRTQLHLLRVLQDMEFERVGDSTPIKADVRVVAATNKNLMKEIEKGKFRQDLYYRLKVVQLDLPPLRDRSEDIPILTNHFLKRFNTKFSKKITAVSKDVQNIFMTHPWPGNIRELRHAMEHASLLCRDHTIAVNHLPAELKVLISDNNDDDYGRVLRQALEKTRWNKTAAARLLGMSRQNLYRKLKEFKVIDDDS